MLTIEAGDEVILPSWAFPSCANAVILRGAIPVFIDVNEDLNMDADLILGAITPRTKAIMPIHYAGVVCDMTSINRLADMHGLFVIEDAAQALGNWTVSGDIGCLSFHKTKNVQCGEGGALIVRNPALLERAEIMRDCGTTKAKFRRGESDGYDWVDMGSSYLMSEFQAQYLWTELEQLDRITQHRRKIWQIYKDSCTTPDHSERMGNGHIFWYLDQDKWKTIARFRQMGIKASSHYEALHATVPGRRFGHAGSAIVMATLAMEQLIKLDTSVSEEEAHLSARLLWQQTDSIPSIH